MYGKLEEMLRNNIPLFKVYLPTYEILPELEKIFNSGYIGQGPKVEQFETLLKQRFQNQNLVTVNTGTSAIHLGLHLAGVRAGHEVLVSPLSCFATSTPVLGLQAKIKWIDTDPTNFNISLDDIVEKTTEQTKAILFVHWGGIPVDIRLLKEKFVLKGKKLPPIIEDCAHSQGASRYGYPVGSNKEGVPSYCAFSLQAVKHINAIDGGVLTLPNQEEHRRAKLVRWYGIDREEKGRGDFRAEIDIPEWGYKFHLNDVCATIGIVQMNHIDRIVELHRDNAAFYNRELKNIDGITLPTIPENTNPSYWLYTILVERKEDFMRYMKECGITTSRVHERNDTHSCVSEFKTELPMLNSFNHKIINIPVGWWVSPEDREYIVDCIKKGW